MRNGRFRSSFVVTTCDEVAPARSGPGNSMEDARPRLVEQRPLRLMLIQADAQLGLFTADRTRAHPTDPAAESADPLKDLTAKRHVAADQISHTARQLRHSAIGAADDPIELCWKPVG